VEWREVEWREVVRRAAWCYVAELEAYMSVGVWFWYFGRWVEDDERGLTTLVWDASQL